MDIITGQSIIIEQLTSGQEKLMGIDITSVFMVPYKYYTNNTWDSAWRPPGVSVGCTGTPTPYPPAGCAISPWAYSFGSGDALFLFERIISHVWAYSKSSYLGYVSTQYRILLNRCPWHAWDHSKHGSSSPISFQ